MPDESCCMPEITVDLTQAALITGAGGTIHVRDPKGRLVGFITPVPPEEEIAAAKVRLAEGHKGRTYTTDEVLAHLQSLEGK